MITEVIMTREVLVPETKLEVVIRVLGAAVDVVRMDDVVLVVVDDEVVRVDEVVVVVEEAVVDDVVDVDDDVEEEEEEEAAGVSKREREERHQTCIAFIQHLQRDDVGNILTSCASARSGGSGCGGGGGGCTLSRTAKNAGEEAA